MLGFSPAGFGTGLTPPATVANSASNPIGFVKRFAYSPVKFSAKGFAVANFDSEILRKRFPARLW